MAVKNVTVSKKRHQ